MGSNHHHHLLVYAMYVFMCWVDDTSYSTSKPKHIALIRGTELVEKQESWVPVWSDVRFAPLPTEVIVWKVMGCYLNWPNLFIFVVE